ncbi:MAG: SRPBCC domain-containing protein [Hyphomicrobium sp.]
MPKSTTAYTTANPPFKLTRVVEAPRARVWKAWTDASELQHWWGPKGCKLTVESLDFREGGFFHYAMQYSAGSAMWGRFLYREIAAPQRLVWLNSFANGQCGIVRAPFPGDLPLEIQNTVTFSGHDGGTTIALQATPFGASDAENAFFSAMFAGLAQGYGGTLDQLEAHLRG